MIQRITDGAAAIVRDRTAPVGGARPPIDVGLVLEAGRTEQRSRGAERWSVLRRVLALADLAAAAVVGSLLGMIVDLPLNTALGLGASVALVWPALGYVMGLYAGDDLRSWSSGIYETPRLLASSLVLSWPLFGAATGLGASNAALCALASIPLMALASGGARAFARAAIHRVAPLRQRTVIVGSGFVAAQIAQKLHAAEQYGLEPIGIVDDDVHDGVLLDLPRLGSIDDLDDILRRHRVDRVIIAFSRASHERLLQSIRACRDSRIAVDVVPRLFEFLDGARALDQIGGMPLLSIGAPRLSRTSQIAKRALDVAISGAGLLALSPLILVIAAAIKVNSRGPVFFKQVRAGRNRRLIKVLKFRSMYEDADRRKAEYMAANDAGDGVMFKIHHDPRVTRVGRILRRYSLDELPQLINVFKGDMSLVGPRPLILAETAALEEAWHERRLDLRPGMTGPWQVSGRSDVPFQEMVRFDYQYVAGWSLARDLEILLATVPAVLSGRGAY